MVGPSLGGVAECNVVDVKQHFVDALAVPHLMAREAGIGQDDADSALGPGDPGPVLVPRGIMRGWAGDPSTVSSSAMA